MFRDNKKHIITIIILVLVIMFLTSSSVSAATRFNEIINRFYNGFKHIGIVEHQHTFSADASSSGFTASGQGIVGGKHDAWARRSIDQNTFNSSESYTGYTNRAARIGQYMSMVSSYELSVGHTGVIGMLLKPGELGHINQTVSHSSDSKGSYFKKSNNAQNTDGTTKIQSNTGKSSTNIEVEGYSEYREIVIIDRGGKKTGWWDLE